jgi:ABC-type bacteriocin/lantibiotic exporter with double-glycine peptidase domain
MDKLLSKFSKDFIQKNRIKLIWFSFWRIVAFIQVLFWPFALSKIVDILTENPVEWQKALPWLAILVVNNIIEDFIRLRSKYGLQVITTDLEVNLATFFTKNTEVCDDVKTGEAIQRVKKATETINTLATHYRNNLLQIPVNLVIIPLIFLKVNGIYFSFLATYIILYLMTNYIWSSIYLKETQDCFQAAETFWGTTYRKAPEIWRNREDEKEFKKELRKEAKDLFKERLDMENIRNWGWVFVQVLSSLSVGIMVIYVFHFITKGSAPVGDLVLVTGYFSEMQTSLNILTTTATQSIDLKISLNRLEQAVRPKKRKKSKSKKKK